MEQQVPVEVIEEIPTRPNWFAVRADRARARRAEKLFNEQMQQLAWLTRSLDFDSGFGAISLELIGRSDVPLIEADVLRGYDEYADAVVLLQERMAERDGTGLQVEVSRWHGVGQVIGRHLDVCEPPIRRTIEAQLAADQEWLDRMRHQPR